MTTKERAEIEHAAAQVGIALRNGLLLLIFVAVAVVWLLMR